MLDVLAHLPLPKAPLAYLKHTLALLLAKGEITFLMCKHTHNRKKVSQLRSEAPTPSGPNPISTKMEKPSSPLHMKTWEKKSQLRTVAPCPQVLAMSHPKQRLPSH